MNPPTGYQIGRLSGLASDALQAGKISYELRMQIAASIENGMPRVEVLRLTKILEDDLK